MLTTFTRRSASRWAATAAAIASLAGGATALAPAAQAAPAPAPVSASGQPARSTAVALTNSTTQHLTRLRSGLDHGCWSTNSLPPDYIARGVATSWTSESCGFATGTQGHTTYKITGTNDEVTLRWDNPFSGSNSYSCDAPSGYSCNWSGGSGNNASVSFTLSGGPRDRMAKAASQSVSAVTPVRSVRVKVVNGSGTLLARTGAELKWGIWSGDSLPPSLINPNARADWQTESEGFMTGTEGSAEYVLAGGGKVVFRWNNPFSGSNSYACEVPATHSCATAGGGGKNAEVVFTVN
ncbi:Crystal protein ET79 [Streptomyces sp. NPDC059564]|uniref:Crystal protein ET79 n=1 Tax=Streptomyces sp. NPDC059564 TaxID=3346865 RepID=UPI0036B1C815